MRFGINCSVAFFLGIFAFPSIDLVFKLFCGPEGSTPSYGSTTWFWTRSFSVCTLSSKIFPFLLGAAGLELCWAVSDAAIDEKCSETLGTSLSRFTWVDKFDELGDIDNFDFFGVFSNKLGTSFTENVEGASLGVPGWLRHVFEMDDTDSRWGGLARCVSAPSPVGSCGAGGLASCVSVPSPGVSCGVGGLARCVSAPSPWFDCHYLMLFF